MWSDSTLGASFKVQLRYPNLKDLITCLLLVLEVRKVKPTHRKSWARNLLMCSDLTLGPSFMVKRGYPNLEVLIARSLLVLEVCNVKPTYRKSWARNLLMCSDFTLGPLLQGQTTIAKLKSADNLLIIGSRGLQYKTNLWGGNLLMFSDLTLGPSFKVKRWFTGFGELSFRWIQICIGSPMRRSSFKYF